MDAEKKKALESAGWRFGDAADFLGMPDEERQLLDARVEVALAVRRQREALNITQQDLAKRVKTSQPRVARIERAAPDVSLDQLLRVFVAAGGRIVVKRKGRLSKGKPGTNSARADQGAEIQIELIGTEPG